MAITRKPTLSMGGPRDRFRLLRAPVLAASVETALTGSELGRTFGQLEISKTFPVIAVADMSGVELQFLGTGDDDDSNVAQIYGWKDGGQGILIATATILLSTAISQDSADPAPGFHNDSRIDPEIYAAMTRTSDYRFVDTITASNNEAGAETIVNRSNQPAVMSLDFVRLQIDWLTCLFTTFEASTTSLMALWRPLQWKIPGDTNI